jgi:hypothetical protein
VERFAANFAERSFCWQLAHHFIGKLFHNFRCQSIAQKVFRSYPQIYAQPICRRRSLLESLPARRGPNRSNIACHAVK